MKPEVADLLRAVVRLTERDLDELRENIATVDELAARRLREHDRRLSEVEAILAERAAT